MQQIYDEENLKIFNKGRKYTSDIHFCLKF